VQGAVGARRLLGTFGHIGLHMKRLLYVSMLLALAIASTAHAVPFDPAGPDVNAVFGDKPYAIDLGEITAWNSKPPKLTKFSPDSDTKVQGVKIVADGRLIPIVYEVITFPTATDTDTMLENISSSLDNHDDIVLREFGNSQFFGHLLRYYQRVSEKGRPHHVSSNYIFVRDGTVFHIVATSFGPLVVPRENWGDPKPDQNAHDAVVILLRSLRRK
jgi:hypothetical protein